MFNFKIIEENSAKWNELLEKSFNYDFYHTAFYHSLDSSGTNIMLYAGDDTSFIALPLIIREIKGSNYLDATSVYGYCGPISNQPFKKVKHDLVNFFTEELQEYFKEHNIISVFSRLHPLLEQHFALDTLGELVHLNKTVSIDLTLPVDEQRRAYRKSLKSELNQLRRQDYIVKEANNPDEIDAFVDIYHLTMDKLNASESYYFSREYFHDFLGNPDFRSKLLIAKFNGEIVAGAIFTIVGTTMQYHLAGTLEEYSRKAPMKLILDEARLLANSMNLKYLHLGGGVGGEDSDSLFRFKSGFSKNFHQFTVWKFITDNAKYDELVAKKSSKTNDSNFFPLYRAHS